MEKIWLSIQARWRRIPFPASWTDANAARLLALAWVILVSLTLVIMLAMITRPFFFQPLGDYPVPQMVESQRDANGMAVVHMSDGYVIVHATKCSNASTPVHVVTDSEWRRQEGDTITTITGTSGATTRDPGCHNLTYKNQMPSRLTPGVWKLTGDEITVGEGLMTGVPQIKTWETEPFRVEP